MQYFNQYFDKQAKLLIQKANNLRNRSQRQHAYRAALLTVYGFQVAIPVVLGIFLGVFLDKYLPLTHLSWTLNLILLGFLVGLYNANTWFYRMMELQRKNDKKKTQKGRKK